MQKWCVTDVKTLDNYKLLVSFFSGERKIYDAKPLLQYKINEPLKNKTFFNLAHVNEVHTVAWNENIDIAPEALYYDGKTI